MNLQDLNNIELSDLNNIGSAPLSVRILVGALVFLLVLASGYYLHTQGQLDNLASLEKKEQQLRGNFEKRYAQSANLEAFKDQLDEMEIEFGAMIRQLPGQTEIPGIIVDISQTALASGLNILLFKPQDEVKKGFYAEKPILIRLTGQYEQMAKFSSDVAALPRIVTLHDMDITPHAADKSREGQNLIMNAVAKTYRYLDDSETAELIVDKNSKKNNKTNKNKGAKK